MTPEQEALFNEFNAAVDIANAQAIEQAVIKRQNPSEFELEQAQQENIATLITGAQLFAEARDNGISDDQVLQMLAQQGARLG